jgi:hypothetical protein
MTPDDNRRILGLLADQIDRGVALSSDQLKFLKLAFRRIARGEIGDIVFGLNNERGPTVKQARARLELSVIFHWVANATLPVDEGGHGMKISKALESAAELFERDFQYLKNQWYKKENLQLRDPYRSPFDSDFPY